MNEFIFGFWLGLIVGLSIIYSVFIYEPEEQTEVNYSRSKKGIIENNSIYQYSYVKK